MNPQFVSILTSLGLFASSAATTWAVSKGIIPAADQSVWTNDLVGLVGGLATIGLGYMKAQSVSPVSMIQAINVAANGVKVVADTVSAPKVSAPILPLNK